MKIKFLFFVLFLALGLVANQPVKAEEAADPDFVINMEQGTFKCPAPSEVKCKSFAESAGNWTQNGGYRMSTNTAFSPNNQCANVIPINVNGMSSRLLCCYKECGVLYLDVKFRDCKKVSVSDFRCQ